MKSEECPPRLIAGSRPGKSETYKIAVLPGDGIGPEVVRQAIHVLKRVAELYDLSLDFGDNLAVGGVSIDRFGQSLTDKVLDQVRQADAVLLGAVGGPKWESMPHAQKPEAALLALRKELGLYANLRPVKVYAPLAGASPIRTDRVKGVDLVMVRELIGGIYFGRPKGIEKTAQGVRRGFNTMEYTEPEIERIARRAFELARQRRKKVTSVDKANVLETSALWREVVTDLHCREYADIALDHLYVDNCAMQLVRQPKQFDVILTENLFGDILSDEAAVVAGSIGLLASASLGDKHALYEPVHGSAPDIAGKDQANPLATILSAAMMLRWSFTEIGPARLIERAVEKVLSDGWRTADLVRGEDDKKVSCSQMGQKVLEALPKVVQAL